MTPSIAQEATRDLDPVETIHELLQRAWNELSAVYDVSTCLPDLNILFPGIDLDDPRKAAESLIAGMLLEIMENISRFSPWYRVPARSFGVISFRDPSTRQTRWLLAPEAVQRWNHLIGPLTEMIQRFGGLLRAMVLVDGLTESLPGDPCVQASCRCIPPRTIYLRKSILEKAEIICDTCLQPYQ